MKLPVHMHALKQRVGQDVAAYFQHYEAGETRLLLDSTGPIGSVDLYFRQAFHSKRRMARRISPLRLDAPARDATLSIVRFD